MTADPSTSGRILAVVTDLILESRITEGARALGYAVTTAGSTHDVREALSSHSVDLIVLDLQADGVPWKDIVMAASEAANGRLPILAFGQHTRPDLLQAARDGGCDVVVPRSRLVEEFPALIEQSLGRN
jgi:AmiR/NasT family two-component response regulator